MRETVRAEREAMRSLGMLVEVELRRRNSVRDATTGRYGYEAAVTVEVLVAAVDVLTIGTRDSLVDGKHTVTFYGEGVGVGDRLTWDGDNHEVLKVGGVVDDAATGRVYRAAAVVN